jgi:hypothetical protein
MRTVDTSGYTEIRDRAHAQWILDRVLMDKSHPYFDRNHRAHDQAVKEVNSLFEYLHPEG